ncbi:MAG TPA: YlbF family regulator [Bacillales bacterium]|nr:YlbF family regulator [Bacillales bacterium]
MIATLEGAALLDEADILAKMITNSETAEHYKACQYKLQHNEEAQLLIQRFTKMKEAYEEVQRFGKYHPEFDKVTKEVRELKRQVDTNDTIAAFKKAEEDLEALLNELSQMIAYAVSPQIKVPTGNPFFDNMRCGGGCGAGGKCNCKAG